MYPKPLYSRPDSAIITAGKQELVESTGIGDNFLKRTASRDKIWLFSKEAAVEKFVELCPEIKGKNLRSNQDSILKIVKTIAVLSANRSIHSCPKQARNFSLGPVPLKSQQE